MEDFKEFLSCAIELEEAMAQLYLFYHETFVEDREFWWQLANEEKNHSALLKTGISFIDTVNEPRELIVGRLSEVKEAVEIIQGRLREYKEEAPSKEEAYTFACDLESISYEKNYQEIMVRRTSSEIMKIFQSLNKADKNHFSRIKSLLSK